VVSPLPGFQVNRHMLQSLSATGEMLINLTLSLSLKRTKNANHIPTARNKMASISIGQPL
jgi:hypothetical protein